MNLPEEAAVEASSEEVAKPFLKEAIKPLAKGGITAFIATGIGFLEDHKILLVIFFAGGISAYSIYSNNRLKKRIKAEETKKIVTKPIIFEHHNF